jgi:hypothetical protein
MDEIPPWSSTDSVVRKAWRQAIRSTGKADVVRLLEPRMRALAEQICNEDHTAHDRSASIVPSDRKVVMLAALDEIAAQRPREPAIAVCKHPGRFTLGVAGDSGHVLGACVSFIEAVCAPRSFEQKVLACLSHLNRVDAESVDAVRRMLRRPRLPVG